MTSSGSRFRRSVAKLASAGLLLVLAIMVGRALTLKSRQPVVTKLTGDAPVDTAEVARRLGAAIAFRTVTTPESPLPIDELRKLHAWLATTYPHAHQALTHENVGTEGGSLLFTWRPANDTGKAPIILCAHMDVVPVEDEASWTHPPFEGVVEGGFVWGRGALDDKLALVGIFEAVESLVTAGFAPDRTIYLAFGQDEEISGKQGAGRIVELLRARGVAAELALDEGGIITHGVVAGVSSPIAAIAIAEKGYLTLDLRAELPGGHSSSPRSENALTVIARAIDRLQGSPMPARLDDITAPWIAFITPEQTFGMKLALSNLWITRPLVTSILASKPATNAGIRTTTAVTMMRAGVKDNVIPASASATVNFRLLAGDSVAAVIEHVKTAIADTRVVVTPREDAHEASAVSSIDGPGFGFVARAIREVDDGTLVMPINSLGATDGRKYQSAVAKDVYRFLPARLTGDDLTRIHGKDERAALADVDRAVRFYRRFIVLAASQR